MSYQGTPSTTASLKLLLRYLKSYKLMLLGVTLSLLITSGMVLAISQAVKFFIDSGIAKGNSHFLNEALLFLGGTILLLAFFTACRYYLITMIGEKVVTDLRRDIYQHILHLSPRFFETNKSGDILSRMTADSTVLLTIIGSSFSVALRNIVMLMGGIALLLSTSLKLASILLILIPLIVLPIIFTGKKLRNYTKKAQDRVADITIQTEQALNSIITIQAYLRENYEKNIFNDLLKKQLFTSYERIRLRAILTALIISLVFGGIAFVLWIGGHEVLAGRLSAGELSAFVYIGIICAGAVAALSDVMGDLQKAAGATERIFEFLSIIPEVKESNNPLNLPKITLGKIEFKNVFFSYEPKKQVLKDVSFTVKAGKLTALIGKSGVGKTTIFMLLERFYDINEGAILFDGVDIKKLSLKDLRSQFTFVTQDAIIFSTTIYENILYGNPSASKDEVYNAAQNANCLEFIEKMPYGFETYLGNKGMKLSNGQKQRISIARALLNDPKILLLDEATSSLDSENELLVQEALETLMKDRTTIVIAHRLSTVKKADKIIVLENGGIKEEGTHEVLIKKKDGLYKKLANLQFQR